MLERVGSFDQSFPYYGWEDIDLGYRLREIGIPIIYNPGAVGYHCFDTTMYSYLKKRYFSGKSLAYLLSRHPELRKDFRIANISFFLALLKASGAIILLLPSLLAFKWFERPLFRIFDSISNLALYLGLRSFERGAYAE